LGALVAVEREPTRPLPRVVPFLRGVLHAPFLGRARAAARKSQRGLRALRRRPRAGELPRDPARAALHPSGRVHAQRACVRRLDPRHVPCGAGGDARSRIHALPRRAFRQAARRAPARVAGGARVTTAEKYVTAAYCVVFAVVLVYLLIMALKLQRLEREVDELADRVPDEDAEEAPREPARGGWGSFSAPRPCSREGGRSALWARGAPRVVGEEPRPGASGSAGWR